MTKEQLFKLKYPVGKFVVPEVVSKDQVATWIDEIERFPTELEEMIGRLSEEQLNSPYRPEGWTGKQVIHHVADSHINSFVRFKWTLTEDKPTIKAYKQEAWAGLIDSEVTPVDVSLKLLTYLHLRWVPLLRSLGPEELKRTFVHPESWKEISLDVNIGLYAWHGRHHLGHLAILAAG